MTRIVVMNCNTSSAMTADIGRQAQASASPGTRIDAWHPHWGPESAEGYYDSYITAAAVLDRLHDIPADVDAVVMAGFGEHVGKARASCSTSRWSISPRRPRSLPCFLHPATA